MAVSESTTPMMRQFHRIKAAHPDSILFFRLGDFYEMFFEDAIVASDVLEITLTARNRGGPNEAPMCGVPHHSASQYIARLVRAGHKVAIAEQVADRAAGKTTLHREVVRVITPGTLIEDDLLQTPQNNFVVAMIEREDATGAAALDVSTAEFVAAEFAGADARAKITEEISRWGPREICFPQGQELSEWVEPDCGDASARPTRTWTSLPAWTFEAARSAERLCEHFGVASLDGYDLHGQELAVGAAGALLKYVAETHQAPLRHIHTIRRYRDREALQLDAVTRRTLELVESGQMSGSDGSLLDVIEPAITAMGARRLRQWLLRPLRDRQRIESRLEVVAAMTAEVAGRDGVRQHLGPVRDLERLTTRVSIGSASPRDLGALRSSLEALPLVLEQLVRLEECPLGLRLREQLDPCQNVAAKIAGQLTDEAPAKLSEGDVIRAGVSAELDRLRRVRSDSKGFIAALQQRERETTGIGSLKVGYNKVFGYYIEVSKVNLAKVPESYIRKQTLSGAERFFIAELKEFEEAVLGAEERILALEEQLFVALRMAVAQQAARLHRTANAIGQLDALAALAETACRRRWVCPGIRDDLVLEVHGGRHPVVESLQIAGEFVANDVYLDGGDHRIQLITGPNMGGKSTYLRQVALIVILAQMGSFVPASSAAIGVVDRIFTRVGASDNLARGASTFLVEMQEVANILHNASDRSLVLLDEVGRGTSTYDGLAIAWAVLEQLQRDETASPRTLFATHYHELTELGDRLPGLRNLHVAVHETGDGVVFLHRVEPGSADRSYGIHVARLAGLPQAVVDRARAVLVRLQAERGKEIDRSADKTTVGSRPSGGDQFELFAIAEHPLANRLQELDLDRLSPLEALNLLVTWKSELGPGQEEDRGPDSSSNQRED